MYFRDVWDDKEVKPVINVSRDRVGFPTQKPLPLYERIITASSNEGDIVLDPFAGCATTCIAAEQLNRRWVGIDIWKKASDVVIERMNKVGLFAPKHTRRSSENLQQYLFAQDFHFTKSLPKRTDDEEVSVSRLPTLNRAILASWQRMSNPEIRQELEEAQQDDEDWIVCAGCGRQLEGAFMELDHILPRSSRGSNDISNRILLCSPCNRKKSNTLTMSGLRKANRKDGWMLDEKAAKAAEIRAHNKYVEISNQG